MLIITASVCSGYAFLDIVKNYVKPAIRNNVGMTKYDFIIVGAGSAGSVLANRLSENKKWRILLLEEGNLPNPLSDIPLFVSYFQATDFNWKYKIEPQKNSCLGMINRQCSWPRGRVLGGTSILNYMIHTRGNKQDYEKWAQLGNVGWSFADVLPYFKKSEKFNIPGGSAFAFIVSNDCTL